MSVTSKTQIANKALVKIGAKRITDLADDSNTNARTCNEVFDQIAEEVIRSGEWNCLKARANLPQATTPEFGWDYAYTMPEDCARVIKINGTYNDAEPGDTYEVEGRLILTNAESAKVQYVKLDLTVAKWDALLIAAVATRLASEIVTALRADDGQASQRLLAEYEQVHLPKARVKDGNERKRIRRNPADESRFVQSRRFSTNG
jgi:hypothetical protein